MGGKEKIRKRFQYTRVKLKYESFKTIYLPTYLPLLPYQNQAIIFRYIIAPSGIPPLSPISSGPVHLGGGCVWGTEKQPRTESQQSQ